jgi:eukaryotic-like serine/threonine-protein kinase
MGRRLGRYELLGKIAQGGMAEVWLARQSGPQGFSKLAVIKQILPELAEDQKFVQMFLDEARLAALLNHPNVVHIYELGEDDQNGAAYTAMEYIDGVTLKRLAEKAAETGTHLPFELVGRIISDACAGINFAHELKNLEGQPLNMVHRDISPDNILITYSGQVKIVDFGIARAATATSDRTRSGVFKGKLAYASPEYLEGKPFDRRADIWAMGVTLYWTLTGKKPFPAMAPEALRQQIAGGTFIPPRDVDGDIPWELEEIVTRALEKDPDQRYQTGRELQDAMDTWIRAYGKDASSRWLSDYMNKLFPEQRDPERLRLRAMTMRAGNTRPSFDEADPDEKTRPGEDLPQEIRDELAAAPKTPPRPSGPSGSNRLPPGQSGSSRLPSGSSRLPPALAGSVGANTPSGQSLGDILFDAATSTAIGAGRIDLDDPKPDFRPTSTGSAPLLEGPPTTTGIRRDDIYEEAPPRRSLKIVGAVAVVAVLVVGAGAVIAATRTPPRRSPPVFPRPAPTATGAAAPSPSTAPALSPVPTIPPQALPAAPSGPITVAAPPQPAMANPAPPPQPVAAPAPTPPAPAPPAPVVVSPPPIRTHKETVRRAHASPGATSGTGELSVLVAPWADVFVDGQKVGTTPFAPIELPQAATRSASRTARCTWSAR